MGLPLRPGPDRPQPSGQGVSSQLFLRTVATAILANETIDLASELLGDTDARITLQHYIRRNDLVDPTSPDILERVFARNQKNPRT